MKNVLITDFSKVLINPIDETHELYQGSLNGFHRSLKENLGDQYRILDYFELNQELLDFYNRLKQHGIRVVIFTSETIQEDPDLQPRLNTVFGDGDVFSAMRLEVNKADSDAYKQIISKLNLDVSNAVFIDDSVTNVSAATNAGLTSIQFVSNDQAMQDLAKLFEVEI